jgi:GH15 family glucan-1,4-alpha-glucosidase
MPVARFVERIAAIGIVLFSVAAMAELPQRTDGNGAEQKRYAPLELTRATRPWEFASALGTRSALFAREDGNFEAWVYPLKILRNFHLRFKTGNQTIDSKAVARSIRVRPESTTITYAWDTFSVQETLFVPVDEPGAVVILETDSSLPIEIEAVFERDFQLEWPAPMGGSDIDWVPALHAFLMDENQRKFTALVGSPSATSSQVESSTNYTNVKENTIGLGIAAPGKSTRILAIAASFQGLPPVEATYKRLVSSYTQLLAQSADYYSDYLQSKIALELPDKPLEEAYRWAEVSVLQGLVANPYLGTGLVAGYKGSADNDQRPGYAWFFGRDALWTSLALDAEGDFTTTRTALEFLSKYQRKDGKVPHEIAQGAGFVPWFDTMPYAYASADATPLYIVAMDDYLRHSGDAAFVRDKWDNIWRAYQFLISTYDKDGLPQNEGIGHGWVEGGPLLPVKGELYQSAVAAEALKSLAHLAHVLGKEDQAARLASDYEHSRAALNNTFWIADQGRYAFAIDTKGKQNETVSVLSAVPMWFGQLDRTKADSMIEAISTPEIQTSWGMRIIPSNSPHYEADGYHSGTVWPLFTGWAAVGEYRYHHTEPAYANLRSNALLTFDGSLGHVTEVLSGNYYQTLATGSPQQIWSSAMVVAAMLKGLLGLDQDALANHVTLEPHIPADWPSFAIHNIKAGQCSLNISYSKQADKEASETLKSETLKFEIESSAGKSCSVELSPSVSLRAQVLHVDLNGRSAAYRLEDNAQDQHIHIAIDPADLARGSASVEIRLKEDFGILQDFSLPALGGTNDGLRIVAKNWNEARDTLTLDTESAVSGAYELGLWNPEQISSVEGADLVFASSLNDNASEPRAHRAMNAAERSPAHLRIVTTSRSATGAAQQTVVLHFIPSARRKNAAESSTKADAHAK